MLWVIGWCAIGVMLPGFLAVTGWGAVGDRLTCWSRWGGRSEVTSWWAGDDRLVSRSWRAAGLMELTYWIWQAGRDRPMGWRMGSCGRKPKCQHAQIFSGDSRPGGGGYVSLRSSFGPEQNMTKNGHMHVPDSSCVQTIRIKCRSAHHESPMAICYPTFVSTTACQGRNTFCT